MKVFISWSGARSKAIAELISEWIKCVLQASEPWVSTRDIGKGVIWFNEISDRLNECTCGIVCLTSENKDKPWILFEAGALAKGLSKSRVYTLLVDLQAADIEDPLAQFNHTLPTRNDIWELVFSLNNGLEEKRLSDSILQQVFETYWPQFELKFRIALEENPIQENIPPRSEESILSEILNNTRHLTNRIRDLENRVVPFGFSDSSGYENSITSNPEIEISNLLRGGITREKIIDMYIARGHSMAHVKKLIETCIGKYKTGSETSSLLSERPIN